MDHLTIDEIIEFVSASKLDEDMLALMAKVNQHIRTCPKCFDVIEAFQRVNDEFAEMREKGELKKSLHELIKDENELIL